MTSPSEPPDAAVLAKLVERHREFLAFVERRVGDSALAEDILQDAFVKSLGKASALRDGESATAWFYRVLRNALIDRRRRSASGARGLEVADVEFEERAEDVELQAIACRCVVELSTTLKPEYAAALRRVDLEGVAVKDFAAEAGITANNAAVRVFRAREALRDEVVRSCRTCAEHGCFDCTCSRSERGQGHGHGHGH